MERKKTRDWDKEWWMGKGNLEGGGRRKGGR
jgi:hypothetical protein